MSTDIWGGIQPSPAQETTSDFLDGFDVKRASSLLPITPIARTLSMEKIYEMTGTGGGERELIHRDRA